MLLVLAMAVVWRYRDRWLIAALALGAALAVKPLMLPVLALAADHAPRPGVACERRRRLRPRARQLGRDRVLGPALVSRAPAGLGSHLRWLRRLDQGAGVQARRAGSPGDVPAARRRRCAARVRVAALARPRGRPALVLGGDGRGRRRSAGRLVALPRLPDRAAGAGRCRASNGAGCCSPCHGCSDRRPRSRCTSRTRVAESFPRRPSSAPTPILVMLEYLLADRCGRARHDARQRSSRVAGRRNAKPVGSGACTSSSSGSRSKIAVTAA